MEKHQTDPARLTDSEAGKAMGSAKDPSSSRPVGSLPQERDETLIAKLIAERDEARQARDEAQRTVASIAAMLGWENVPPRRTLESDVAALKARVAEVSRLTAQLQEAQKLHQEVSYVCHDQADKLIAAESSLTALREPLEELKSHAEYSLATGGQRTRPVLFVPSVAKRVLEIVSPPLAALPSPPSQETPDDKTTL